MRFSTPLFLLLFCVLLSPLRAADEAKTFSIAGLTFACPSGWNASASPSAMRKETLTVHSPQGDADCAFFYFGTDQGGDVKSNVERWASQFTGAEDKSVMATQEFGANKVTLVKAEGTYTSGMPGSQPTPQKDYALVGAIIETGQGKVFVKMTGPKSVIASSEAAFVAMVNAAASAK